MQPQSEKPRHIQLSHDTCIWCGEPLSSKRITRKYHDTCRQKYYKWKRRIVSKLKSLEALLDSMRVYLAYDDTRVEAISAYKSVCEKIETIYRENRIVRVR